MFRFSLANLDGHGKCPCGKDETILDLWAIVHESPTNMKDSIDFLLTSLLEERNAQAKLVG